MVDVIVYKPSPYGLVFIHDKPLGLRLGFIIYHVKHERVFVSCIFIFLILRWPQGQYGYIVRLVQPISVTLPDLVC